jgi:hypothetical protein
VFVEQLACELDDTGASERDLRDSIKYMRSLPAEGKGLAASAKHEWLPYLELRLGASIERLS